MVERTREKQVDSSDAIELRSNRDLYSRPVFPFEGLSATSWRHNSPCCPSGSSRRRLSLASNQFPARQTIASPRPLDRANERHLSLHQICQLSTFTTCYRGEPGRTTLTC